MFTEAWVQEVSAIAIAAGAAAYLACRFFGLGPRRRSDQGPPVALSERLARGITRAHRKGRAGGN